MSLERDIGVRIKSRRKASGLTLKQLAAKVGCSDAYLSQVETGRVSPSIASLKKIADSLHAKITDFFVEGQKEDPVVLAESQRDIISLDRWNATIQSLVKNPSHKRMHPFFTTIAPGGGSEGLYSHVGEEFGLVLHGELEIELNRSSYRVRENESFYYDSSDPHSWTNPTEEVTVVIWVVCPPTF